MIQIPNSDSWDFSHFFFALIIYENENALRI